MSTMDEKAIKIAKSIREIKTKQKKITTDLLRTYVTLKFRPDGILKTQEMVDKVQKEANKHFIAHEMFKKENAEKILDDYNIFLDEILSYQKKSDNKRIQNLIVGGIVLIFVFWLAVGNINDKYKDNYSSTDSSQNYISKNKLKNDCKWCNILRYAILKNDNNRAVDCRQNYIDNGYYILCTYEAGGYNKKALFYEGLNEVYAVNGTARAKVFTKYNDIKLYDPAQYGKIDIYEILSKF